MTLTIPASIAKLIKSIEETLAPIDELGLAGKLDEVVGDADNLTPEEKRGCIAEILGLRLQTMGADDRGPWDSYFGPMTVLEKKDGTKILLPDAANFDQEIIQHWIKRSEQTPHPTLKARYADLAWEMGRYWNRTHSNQTPIDISSALAQRATEAYLESVASEITESDYQAWRFIDRAIDLALVAKNQALQQRAKEAAFIFHRQQTALGKPTFWWKLDDLMWDRKGLSISYEDQREIIDSLQAALNQHSDINDKDEFNPHFALDAADRLVRRLKRNNPSEAIEAVRKAGVSFELMAQRASGLTAIAWLEDLLTRYRDQQMMVDAARVEAAIRSRATEAQQSMKRIEIPIQIPPDQIEKWLDQITNGTVDEALARIAIKLLTKKEKILALIKTTAADAPLSAHLPIGIMGPSGFTAAKIGSIEDDLSGRMLHQTADLIGMTAPWVHAAFDRIKSQHGLDADIVFQYLIRSPFIAAPTHGILREGTDAWFSADYVKSIHVLVPQVESGLREIMKSMGESVMKANKDSGGFDTISMGQVLRSSAFKARFDPTARLHLRALYTEPKGINLRNRLAHGLAGPELLGAGVANWVMHSLLLIASMVITREENEK